MPGRVAAIALSLLIALPVAAQTPPPSPSAQPVPASSASTPAAQPAAEAPLRIPPQSLSPSAPAPATQPASQPAVLSVGAEATTSEVSRRLSGRELLKKLRLNLDVQTPLGKYLVNIADDADVERAKNQFAGMVALIVGQQQRLPMISQVVHRGLDKVNSVDPDLDKLLAALAAGYPDLNFQDPQVLKVLRRNSALLVNTTAGVLAEPNSLGLFALIEPELAARFYLVSLQDRLAARGDWDPLGNARLKDQIDQLDRALSMSDPDSGQRLVRLQNLLKDMGILVPNTAEGGRILVDKVFNRFQEILDGKNLPATVDVVSRSQQTLLGKFFDKLDARIAQLQAPAPPTGQAAPAATTANPIAR